MEKTDFCKRLSKLRIEKGVSARDMSLSLGLSASYINNVENGVMLPSMDTFFLICDYLETTPEGFFSSDISSPQKHTAINRGLISLTDHQLDILIHLIKEFS